MSQQHTTGAGVHQHAHRDFARVRAIFVLVTGLTEDTNPRALQDRRDNVDRRKRRADREFDPVGLRQVGCQRLGERACLGARLEHLPVAGNQWTTTHDETSGIAATPGRTRPSSNSRLAPPPVET